MTEHDQEDKNRLLKSVLSNKEIIHPKNKNSIQNSPS